MHLHVGSTTYQTCNLHLKIDAEIQNALLTCVAAQLRRKPEGEVSSKDVDSFFRRALPWLCTYVNFRKTVQHRLRIFLSFI